MDGPLPFQLVADAAGIMHVLIVQPVTRADAVVARGLGCSIAAQRKKLHHSKACRMKCLYRHELGSAERQNIMTPYIPRLHATLLAGLLLLFQCMIRHVPHLRTIKLIWWEEGGGMFT